MVIGMVIGRIDMAYEMEMLKHLMGKLQSEQKQAFSELSRLPEGRLLQEKHGERIYYYHLLGVGKDRVKIGITKNTDLVYQLAHKEYLTMTLRKLAQGMKCIDGIAANMDFNAWQDAAEEVTKKFPALATEVFFFGNQYDPNPRSKSTMFIGGTIHRTQKGIKVRSKSELFIADMLESLGIPYQYEVELPYGGHHFCPDFTVIRPRDGKSIFWEHFGMTHDENYLRKMDLKLDRYRNMGILPWENLMISYDREDGSLDASLIRALIEGWLR